ncbi:MarR family winged helix-turn-helix transcriptional regulator [Nocardia sp. NPDC055053]
MDTTGDHAHLRLDEHPTFLLAQLGVHTTERFSAALASLGIQPRHVAVLSVLSDSDGLSQQQLCDSLHIHRNVMVGIVDELERREFVERRKHPANRRAYAVHVLPAGKRLLVEAERVLDGYEAEFTSSLQPDERREFLALLQRLAVNGGLHVGAHYGCGADPVE